MSDLTPVWDDLIFDSFLQQAAIDYIKEKKPRVLFLVMARRTNGPTKLVTISTSRLPIMLIVSFNPFGKPSKPSRNIGQDYVHHYRRSRTRERPLRLERSRDKTQGAEGIWLAILGPDTPALGERTQTKPITQDQIAATMAALLSEDYRAGFPERGCRLETF